MDQFYGNVTDIRHLAAILEQAPQAKSGSGIIIDIKFVVKSYSLDLRTVSYHGLSFGGDVTWNQWG